eukprot:758757-Rhodomonas_salina.4
MEIQSEEAREQCSEGEREQGRERGSDQRDLGAGPLGAAQPGSAPDIAPSSLNMNRNTRQIDLRTGRRKTACSGILCQCWTSRSMSAGMVPRISPDVTLRSA